MPNMRQKDRHVRKLTRVGRASFCVTLPLEYLAKLRWKEKQKLKVLMQGRSVVIRDWK